MAVAHPACVPVSDTHWRSFSTLSRLFRAQAPAAAAAADDDDDEDEDEDEEEEVSRSRVARPGWSLIWSIYFPLFSFSLIALPPLAMQDDDEEEETAAPAAKPAVPVRCDLASAVVRHATRALSQLSPSLAYHSRAQAAAAAAAAVAAAAAAADDDEEEEDEDEEDEDEVRRVFFAHVA